MQKQKKRTIIRQLFSAFHHQAKQPHLGKHGHCACSGYLECQCFHNEFFLLCELHDMAYPCGGFRSAALVSPINTSCPPQPSSSGVGVVEPALVLCQHCLAKIFGR